MLLREELSKKVEAKRVDINNLLVSNAEVTAKLNASNKVIDANNAKLAILERTNAALVKATGSNQEIATSMMKMTDQNEVLVSAARSVHETNNSMVDRLLEAATGLTTTIEMFKKRIRELERKCKRQERLIPCNKRNCRGEEEGCRNKHADICPHFERGYCREKDACPLPHPRFTTSRNNRNGDGARSRARSSPAKRRSPSRRRDSRERSKPRVSSRSTRRSRTRSRDRRSSLASSDTKRDDSKRESKKDDKVARRDTSRRDTERSKRPEHERSRSRPRDRLDSLVSALCVFNID